MRIILASGSPRRRELLTMLLKEPVNIIRPEAEECPPDGAGPGELCMALSREKALEVREKCEPDDVIIAADTIVWIDGEVLGKPGDATEAAAMLRRLSGREHEVFSGVTVLRGDKAVTEAETTRVRFRELSDAEITAYIETGEPMDKAGAYGIQGLGSLLVEEVHGDFFNVMGLPICRLGKMLGGVGVNLLTGE